MYVRSEATNNGIAIQTTDKNAKNKFSPFIVVYQLWALALVLA